jgi:hypothetical protein
LNLLRKSITSFLTSLANKNQESLMHLGHIWRLLSLHSLCQRNLLKIFWYFRAFNFDGYERVKGAQEWKIFTRVFYTKNPSWYVT